jgi:hypothetical protein
MANIDEELRLASEARAAIEKKPAEILKILHRAAFIAQAQQTPTIILSDAALNKARRNVVSALASLIPALGVHRETSTRMDNAKDAIDEWIMEIKAKRAWSMTDDD